jgi:Fic family protein
VNVSTAGEPFEAFVPVPLPPDPPLLWSPDLRRRFDDALLALGRLDALTALLPNASLLLYSFVRNEAVLSSQIEGTHLLARSPCIRRCNAGRSPRLQRW